MGMINASNGINAAATVVNVVPGWGQVASVALVAIGKLVPMESKSNANQDRTAGRFYRAGAPVAIAAVMYRRPGSGAQEWADAVNLLGLSTEKQSGQTKHGYGGVLPPTVVRPDYSDENVSDYGREAREGLTTSKHDNTADWTKDWMLLLRHWGIDTQGAATASAITMPVPATSIVTKKSVMPEAIDSGGVMVMLDGGGGGRDGDGGDDGGRGGLPGWFIPAAIGVVAIVLVAIVATR